MGPPPSSPRPGRPPTISDIAAQCGVAKGTVSKVLGLRSRHYEVSQELRQKIRAAATALGYVPDSRHQHWRGTSTQAVGLFYGDTALNTAGIFGHIPHAVAALLKEHGYMLLSIPVIDGLGSWERVVGDIRLDGCLVVAPYPSTLPAYIQHAGLPAVIINEASSAGIIAVQPDDAGGTRLAIDHLRALGHRRIAYVGPWTTTGHFSERLRHDSYAEVMAEAGGSPCCTLTSPAALRSALVDSRHRPTAILTYSDRIAFEVMPVIRELGLEIPRDVSVVTFNNPDAAALVTPPLTVVDVPTRHLATTATHALLGLIAGEPGASSIVPETLIVRASTAPPRKPRR